MRTPVKQNGTSKKETTTAKTAVVKKLAQEAVTSAPEKAKKDIPKAPEPTLNLDDKINLIDKLNGISTKRQQLVSTLSNLTRFNYNSSESTTFYLRDATGLEFKTTNSNLIHLVATQLQDILETKKADIEKQLLEFKL